MIPAAPASPYKIKIKTYQITVNEPPPLAGAVQYPRIAAPFLSAVINEADAGREHFAVMFLDNKGRNIACKILFSGDRSTALVFPSEVCRAALLLGAGAVIIAHNHPGGDLTPSREDIELTIKLEGCLKMLDIKLLDHLIISGDRWQALNSSAGWAVSK